MSAIADGLADTQSDSGSEESGSSSSTTKSVQSAEQRSAKGGPSWLDWLQRGLDVVGCIPLFGEAADGANGLISLARGDYTGAAFCFVSMIPGYGDAVGKSGKAIRFIARHGDEAAELAGKLARGFRSFTARNFSENLARLTGKIPKNAHAHHVLPQKFEDLFGKAGINIHDPRYGAWVDADAHARWSYRYNEAWREFFEGNQNPTKEQILEFARKLAKRFKFKVNF